MSWSHILAFIIGVSVTIGGYETNRMFAQPSARAAISQKAAPQKKKASKAAASAKKKATAKRKKAAAANAKKSNEGVAADPAGRTRRVEARAAAEAGDENAGADDGAMGAAAQPSEE